MNIFKRRRQALQAITSLTSVRGEVLAIQYSRNPSYNGEDFSPMITSIVIKSLDNRISEIFAIHLEADLVNCSNSEIEGLYPELELSMLKRYNNFLRNHRNHQWLHWDMIDVEYSFSAIKHRYMKLAGEQDSNKFYEIPTNRKHNICDTLIELYGSKYSIGIDQFARLIKLNNSDVIHPDYLSPVQESDEFNHNNYQAVVKSLRCKVDFICRFVDLITEKRIAVDERNRYAVFIFVISHPIFNLVGWIVGILSFLFSLFQPYDINKVFSKFGQEEKSSSFKSDSTIKQKVIN